MDDVITGALNDEVIGWYQNEASVGLMTSSRVAMTSLGFMRPTCSLLRSLKAWPIPPALRPRHSSNRHPRQTEETLH